MARDFHCGFKIAVYARRLGIRRVVEREGVMKFPPALSRKASVQAATSSHFRHIERNSGGVGLRFFGLASRRFRRYRWGPSDQAVHSRGQPPDGFGEGWLRS